MEAKKSLEELDEMMQRDADENYRILRYALKKTEAKSIKRRKKARKYWKLIYVVRQEAQQKKSI